MKLIKKASLQNSRLYDLSLSVSARLHPHAGCLRPGIENIYHGTGLVCNIGHPSGQGTKSTGRHTKEFSHLVILITEQGMGKTVLFRGLPVTFHRLSADTNDHGICLTENLILVTKITGFIDGLGINTCMIKIKKIASRSLKGNGADSGLRIVYAHFKAEERIVYIELYFKGDKENEDKDRILMNFDSCKMQ